MRPWLGQPQRHDCFGLPCLVHVIHCRADAPRASPAKLLYTLLSSSIVQLSGLQASALHHVRLSDERTAECTLSSRTTNALSESAKLFVEVM